MEGSGILFVIVLSLINSGLLAGADEFDLKVNVEHITVNVGEKPEFECSTKKDALYLISYPLEWVQIGREKDAQPRVISALGNVLARKDQFKIDLVNNDKDRMAFKLSFLQGIRNSYDGYFQCRIANKTQALAFKTVEVHVIRMMQKMSFSFGGTTLEETGLSAYANRVKEGTYPALCKAERSNPEADVRIYLDNKEQTVTITSIEDKTVTGPPPAFNVQSVVNLQVNPMYNDKILKCVAMVNNDPTMKREIQFKLEIYSVVPEINCGNNTAVIGNMFVDIECFIKLPGVSCADKIIWENGDTGEQYREEQNTNVGGTTATSKEYIVSCQPHATNTVRTVFRIMHVKGKDFKTEFFVTYVNKHGTSKREPVILTQDYSSASSLQCVIYLLYSLVVAALLL